MGFRIPKGESQGEWQPLPVGAFDFRILGVEAKTSSTGNPQLKVNMEVIGPTHASKKATLWLTATAKSYWSVEQVFEALGIDKAETGEVDEDGAPIVEFEEQDLVGRCVRFDVAIEQYNNKPQNRFNSPKVSEYDPYYAELKDAEPTRTPGPAASTQGAKPAAPGGEGTPPRLQRRPRPAPSQGS
jgi:hypothetical protein